MIQALFADIDNTVFSHRTHAVPSSTLCAFQKLHEKGILVFLATGRHLLEIEPQKALEDLYRDGLAAMTGAVCIYHDKVIYEQSLAEEDVRNAVDYLKKHPFPVLFIEKGRTWYSTACPSYLEWQRSLGLPLSEKGCLADALDRPVYQISCFGTRKEAEALTGVMNHSRMVYWSNESADIISRNAGKEKGMEKLLAYCHIPAGNTIAFGDSGNDVEMLKASGIGIAMGNAAEECRKAADWITDSVDEDGIARALYRLGLLEEP